MISYLYGIVKLVVTAVFVGDREKFPFSDFIKKWKMIKFELLPFSLGESIYIYNILYMSECLMYNCSDTL